MVDLTLKLTDHDFVRLVKAKEGTSLSWEAFFERYLRMAEKYNVACVPGVVISAVTVGPSEKEVDSPSGA
jgi:hypothetical protein